MEISSFKIKSNIVTKAPYLYQGRSMQMVKKLGVNTISCSARINIEMRKDLKTNFYQVLSLCSAKVGFEEIKKAYRSMALQFHPDVCPPSTREESTRKFVEVKRAYEILSDPTSRKMYDYELSLVESPLGNDLCSLNYGERRGSSSREVWEWQLNGLRKRSLRKLERMKKGNN